MRWSSTASWAHYDGSRWRFAIDDELVRPITQVSLEECQGSDCRDIATFIDTADLVTQKQEGNSGDAKGDAPAPSSGPYVGESHTGEQSAPIPNPNQPRAVMKLPFTSSQQPEGMMPMGETVQHAKEAPWGHPGIDFQWPYKAAVVIVAAGEVVEVVATEASESSSPDQGGTIYTVAVTTEELIVEYEVTELYEVNPSLRVGSQVVVDQVLGYAVPISSSDGWYMIHWGFGTWTKPVTPITTPEGITRHYVTTWLCPVPYFTPLEHERLERIWASAGYREKDRFPELCNGPYKNY